MTNRGAQLRGALLEEVVLALLTKVGYRPLQGHEIGVQRRGQSLKVRGRGEWHQIDALVAFDHTPAFMYPLRLLVEAKCYKGNRPVEIDAVRNLVGVLKDITENYFTVHDNHGHATQVQRFNYHAAAFSTSGFSIGAQRYAVAHQVFLIEYSHVPLMREIADELLKIDDVVAEEWLGDTRTVSTVRNVVRRALAAEIASDLKFPADGRVRVAALREALEKIGGSYFGMLQGRYPMHLLSEQELPATLFQATDRLRCRVTRVQGAWGFEPMENSDESFRLEFQLPREIGAMIRDVADERELARIKTEQFSTLYISGMIDGLRRTVVLEMDRDWLAHVVGRRRKAAGQTS